MFKSARIKLTAWYVAIIMLVTLSFSAFVYIGVDRSTRVALEAQRIRIERQFSDFPHFPKMKGMPMLDIETLMEIRSQTVRNLTAINFIVLIVSSSLGYLLAGLTLKPIEEMVTKQKRFISDAAHELKTPLTAMKTSMEVSLRDKHLTLEESKETLKSTIEEVDKLSKFTASLLAQSKYQNSPQNNHQSVKLNEVIKEVAKVLEPIARSKEQKINLQLDEVVVFGNKTELHILFSNIIENAIKYNLSNKEVRVSLTKDAHYATTVVEDFGKGIPPKDLDNIFEPFFRSDKSRTDSSTEGYGLGLSIAKEIVSLHRGTIEVESEEGKGSKFIITLPLSKKS